MNPPVINYRVNQTELAALLGVSRQTVIDWTKREWLTKPKPRGNRLMYSIAQVRLDIAVNGLRCNMP